MTDKTAGFYGTSTVIRENLDYYVERAEEAATNAEASETAAAQSESNAATSASSAMADAASASNSASAAQLSADQAETARISAEQASSTAQQSSIDAGVSATDSANSASASATSAAESLASENKAEQWAEEDEDVQVETGKYSAKHWAAKASAAVGLEWGGIGGTLTDQTDLTAALAVKAGSGLVFEANRKQNNEQYAASGMVHFGKHLAESGDVLGVVNEGMWTNSTDVQQVFLGRAGASAIGDSKTERPVVNMAGVLTVLDGINSSSTSTPNKFKFSDAPDGTVTYDSATGTIVQHADSATAFAAETATNKVVAEREDLFGLEAYLEEVSLANPYVYPNGLIQSQAATMNGIATSNSNRPDSYYAVFDGDTTSKGLGVNFWMSSESAQKAMLSDPDNNLYYLDDGRLVQRRIRQRTIAGAGNGKWLNTDVAKTSTLSSDAYAYVMPQGTRDTVTSLDVDYLNGYVSENPDLTYTGEHHRGVYAARVSATNDNIAVNGECYFLVLGVVSRLNQGAYHPSFNSMGCSFFKRQSDYNGKKYWYEKTDAPTITSKADCFDIAPATVPSKVVDWFGFIASGNSGRPDGRYYDAIYADGQGGVDDLRLSAWGITREEALGEKDARFKNGEERGLQKLEFTTVQLQPATSFNAASTIWQTPDTTGISLGDTISVVDAGAIVITAATVTSISPDTYVGWDVSDGTYVRDSAKSYHAVLSAPTNNQVSGEFLQTDVIGDPANILATPDLANGWLGNWIPVIPDGTSQTYSFTRKTVGTVYNPVYTADNGGSWTSDPSYPPTFNTTLNAYTTSLSTGVVFIQDYTAHAYLTEAADNAVVYKGNEGIGDVWLGMPQLPQQGNILSESTIGKVLQGSTQTPLYENQALISYKIQPDTVKFPAAVGWYPEHGATNLPSPPSTQPTALKALSTLTEINGQLFIDYKGKEMVWDFSLDNGTEFENQPETYTGWTINTWYHVTDGRFRGYWKNISSATIGVPLSDPRWSKHNDLILWENGVPHFMAWDGNGWGDDNLIDIVDGVTSGTDLNGNTITKFNQRGAKPLGWVRNTK